MPYEQSIMGAVAMMKLGSFACPIGNLPGRAYKVFNNAMRAASVQLVVATVTVGASPAIAQDREQLTVVFEHALTNAEGKKVIAVRVSYPPGGKSLSHRHAASAFIYAYVLSGAIRSQVGSEPAKVYHQGEGFYELPGSHHKISENASETDSASLLAIFFVDSRDGPLTTPD